MRFGSTREKMKNARRKKKPKAQPDLKALQKEWYAKIADEGFVDIEHTVGTDTSRYFRSTIPTMPSELIRDTTMGYYSMCEQYLRNYQGLRGVDRFLWKHYSAGKTYDEILALHNAKYTKSISMWTLYYRIQDIEADCKAWNLRSPHGYFSNGQNDE
jgi:hypothetical protein